MSAPGRNIVITLQAITTGFQQQMNTAARSVQGFSTQAKSVGPPLQSLNMQIAANSKGLTSFNTLAPVAATQTGVLGDQATKATGGMNKLSAAFSGNKGMIFGLLGITSAGVEAAGMFSMYQMAAGGVAEAQAEVNELSEAGMEGTREYAQAEQELAKQTKWLSMVQRNMILSMFDMVFWTGMVAQGFTKQGGILTKVGGLFTKLKAAITGVTAASGTAAGAQQVYNLSAVQGAGATEMLAGGMDKAKVATLGLAGALAAVAGGIAGALLIIHAVQSAQNEIEKAGVKLTKMGEGGMLMGDPAKRDKSFAEFEKQLEAGTPADWFFRPGQTAGRLKQQGGVDAGGNIITSQTGTVRPTLQQDTAWVQRQLTAGASQEAMQKQLTGTKGPGPWGMKPEEAESVLKTASAQVLNYTNGLDQAAQTTADHANVLIGQLAPALKSGKIGLEQATAATEFWAASNEEGGYKLGESAKQVSELAVAHLTKLVPATKEVSDADKDFFKTMEEGNKSYLQRQADIAKVVEKQKQERDAAIAASAGYLAINDVLGLTTEKIKTFTAIIAETTGGIHEQEATIRDTAAAWTFYTDEQFKADIASQNFILQSIDYMEILDNSRKSILTRNNAIIAGTQATKDFVTETVLSDLANKAHNAGLKEIILSQMELPGWIKFTTEQLQAMVAAMLTGGNEAAILASIIEERLNKSLERFSSLIGAENWKDFKNAWKDIDFGAVPKGVRDSFKDMFNDMRKVAEHGREIATAWDMVITSIITGTDKVSSGDRKRVFKEIGNDLDRIAKIDPEAAGLNNAIIKPLLELKGQAFDKEVLKIADTMDLLTAALQNGDVSAQEYLSVMRQMTLDTSSATMSTSDLITKASELTKQFKEGTIDEAKYNAEMDKLAIAAGGAVEPTNALEAALYAVGGTASSVVTIVASMSTSMTESYGKAAAHMVEVTDLMRQGVLESYGKMVSTMVSVSATAAQSMLDSFGEAFQGIVDAMDDMRSSALSSLGKMLTTMVSTSSKAAQSMLSSFGKAFAAIATAGSKLASAIKSNMSTITSSMKSAESAAKSLQSAISKLQSKTITIKVKYDIQNKPSGLKIQNLDNADNFQNSDTGGGGNAGTQVIHIHIHGNEIVPDRVISKYIKKVSGTNIPQMY
jgi:hypothetical protein